MKKKWVIIILVLVIFVLLISITKTKNTFENKICILLTTCVDNGKKEEYESRKKWYTETIKKYLETTNLQIRVIESSGYEFQIQDEKLKQHSFISVLDKSFRFPTRSEAESILKANESGILDGFDIIIKLTGKYYIPELETEVSKIPNDCGIIYQNTVITPDSTDMSCEIFGFRKDYINNLFSNMLEEKNPDINFEKFIFNIHEKLNCNSYMFPKKMKIECIDKCPYRNDKSTLSEI